MGPLLLPMLLALAQVGVPDSGRPSVEPPSSADIRAIARPDLAAAAVSRGRVQAAAMAASAEELRARHDGQESERQRLQCLAGQRKPATCAR